MSGKLFNFLCSQLERKNSRRTIDLSVNLIFRRIHVYQNGHVPIYRFPSVFFYIFSQKEFFMLTNGTTYQTALPANTVCSNREDLRSKFHPPVLPSTARCKQSEPPNPEECW